MKWAWLQLVLIISAIFFLTGANAVTKQIITIPLGDKNGQRTILCSEKNPQWVRVAIGRVTVINFPFNPKDVVPGEASFDFKKIKNDLVIKAIRPQAKTNLLVYLEDRRCVFDLIAVPQRGDDILIVQDPKDDQIEVPFHD
jgi:type IV secretory pathway VirB9-like protein